MGADRPKQESKLGPKFVAEVFLGVVGLGFFVNQVANEVRVPLIFNVLGIVVCVALIICISADNTAVTLTISALLLIGLVVLVQSGQIPWPLGQATTTRPTPTYTTVLPDPTPIGSSTRTPTKTPTKPSTTVPSRPTNTPTKTPINSNATSTITDNWSSGTFNENVWGDWGKSQVTINNGRLEIDSTVSANYYGIGTKIEPLNLTGSYALDEVIDAGNQQIQSWGCFPVTVSTAPDYDDQVVWGIQDNGIVAYEQTPGGITTIRQGTYNPATQKYFRIRESGGTLYWDYSANGSSWTLFTSLPDPFDITNVILGTDAGTSSDEASTTSCFLDNYNIP